MVVVTTWEPKDIQSGSSDLSLYPYCKKQNIALYVASKMHLKVYSVGLKNAILATGNVSSSGLLPGGNREAGVKLENFSNQDRMFFEKIRKEARLVDDEMYDALVKWFENNKMEPVKQPDLEDIIPVLKNDDFSVASLPMTRRVDDLVSGYVRIAANQQPSDDAETAACVYHDITNYNISSRLSEAEFVEQLTKSFFAHPFIQKIDEFIAPEAYFGRIKEWIQYNCTDVPVPSKRELTGNVQVLLEWFVKLGNGKYVIDVPGARSQRIRIVNN